MYKAGISCLCCLLLVAAVFWGLFDVCNRQQTYLPTRVQVFGNTEFLVLPRYKHEEFSLARRTLCENSTSAGLLPFPNRRAHRSGDIGNAVDLQLDKKGTLWVLDSGLTDTLIHPKKLNEPRVLAIEAITGKIFQVINLGNLISGKAQYLLIDEDEQGVAHLYVSDGPGRSIVVWNIRQNSGHRVLLPKQVAPKTNNLSKVLYIALLEQRVYFTYFGTFELYAIDTAGLQGNGKVKRVGRKDPRMIFLGTSGTELVYRNAGSTEVFAWNSTNLFDKKQSRRVDSGRVDASPMAAIGRHGRIWLLESDLKSFLKGQQPSHNFREVSTVGDGVEVIPGNITCNEVS